MPPIWYNLLNVISVNEYLSPRYFMHRQNPCTRNTVRKAMVLKPSRLGKKIVEFLNDSLFIDNSMQDADSIINIRINLNSNRIVFNFYHIFSVCNNKTKNNLFVHNISLKYTWLVFFNSEINSFLLTKKQ